MQDFEKYLVANFIKKNNHIDSKQIIPLLFNNITNKKLEQIKKLIGDNRGKIVLVTGETQYFDPKSKISRQWLKFRDLLITHKIFNCDFYITSELEFHNTDSIEYLNSNHFGWKFHLCPIDILYFKNIDFLNSNLQVHSKDLFLKECKYKFSYLNFIHRMHRQLFSKFLCKENLIENNLVAINPARQQPIEKNQKQETSLIDTECNDFWFCNKNLLDLWANQQVKYYQHPSIDQNYDYPYLKFLHKAAINIVSETVYDYPYPFMTEKTMQAFLSKRPFIMIGPKANLQLLKKKGFKTFGNIFDETYDNIADPNKRLEKIMQLVLDINKKSQHDLVKMLESSKDVILHNHNLMLEKIKNFTNIRK